MEQKNTSDLGGYTAIDNKKVRSDMLLRSDSLEKLTAADTQTLRDKYHVNLIVDLRTPTQIASKPDVAIPGVENVNFDIFGGVSDWPDDALMYDALAQYPSAVTAYKNFFTTLKTHTGGAILFHCSHGMDRTGVVAALLYHVLGVSNEDVLTNYLQSNTLLNVTWATPDLLNRWYSDIDAEYGSLDKFINTNLGVTAEDRVTLQHKFLTPSDVSLTSLQINGQQVDLTNAQTGSASISVADPSKMSANDVSATPSDPLAKVTTNVTAEKISVTVTGQDRTTTQTYTVALLSNASPSTKPDTNVIQPAAAAASSATPNSTLANTGNSSYTLIAGAMLLLLIGVCITVLKTRNQQ